MKNIGVWIDFHKAYVIHVNGNEAEYVRIDSDVETRQREPGEGDSQTRFQGAFGTQFVDHERSKEARLNNQIREYFHRLAAEISDADNIYIFGPAEAKVQFKKHVDNNHELSQKILAVVTADSMTENQMKAQVRDFYNNMGIVS